MSNLTKIYPATFSQLIKLFKFYALIAFILPFPVAYWTDSLRIDLFAIFYFPISADKLEQTKSGSVGAWLFGITMVYFLAAIWTLITLVFHMLGNDESLYDSMPIYWSAPLIMLYFVFAWYGFGLVKGLNKLLRTAKINVDKFNPSSMEMNKNNLLVRTLRDPLPRHTDL